ncbi:MAG: DUF488 domain-containing protein [Planctomycetes bacterium]|nr:DUF488 domain-containing protein [Planctomycetota bacterium]
MSPPLFTIGHSTHSLDQFLSLLGQHGVTVLADIRRFPGSRKFPHFSSENLASALPGAGIEYHWLEALGGRRRKEPGSKSLNLGLRNESFRNYADYMQTPEFREGVNQLLSWAAAKPTAFMCSESVFWRCHRRLVSDYFLMKGMTVQHIMPSGELRPHTLTEGARIEGQEVTYPPFGEDRTPLLF